MKGKVLIFETEMERQRFEEALRKAAFGAVTVIRDEGWPRPALRIRGVFDSQILAAIFWSGIQPTVLD